MSKWKCGICNSEFDNYQAQGFNGTIYCPLCYFKELYKREKTKNEKAIENCKKSIESINQKLQDDKTIKVIDGKVVNMNEYQIVRLKAIRMKCKELLEILGDKE